ncbi:glycosyl transferase family 90-domain-containing protein [Hyaloraphidium curvatum]|nr:glycosyl transferase family 90-domain-containing protein [Hyaloraphidium curvatum]
MRLPGVSASVAAPAAVALLVAAALMLPHAGPDLPGPASPPRPNCPACPPPACAPPACAPPACPPRRCPAVQRHPWGAQLDGDLDPFVDGITRGMLDGIAAMNLPAVTRYVIVNDTVYTDPPTAGLEWTPWTPLLLLRAFCSHPLPDAELFVSSHDSPLIARDGPRLPLVSFTKTAAHWDILRPYDSLLWWPEDQPRRAWDAKAPRAYWRGSTTGGPYVAGAWRSIPRARLVLACRALKDLCDAEFTGIVQADAAAALEMHAELGNVSETAPPFGHLAYKYAVIVDGNTGVASRSARFLAGGSALLWQQTPYAEFFYSLLRPWVHYIPLEHNLTDLEDKILWARANDGYARQVAEQGRAHAERYLAPRVVDAYWADLLQRYARLQRFDVRLPGNWTGNRLVLGKLLPTFVSRFPRCRKRARAQDPDNPLWEKLGRDE